MKTKLFILIAVLLLSLSFLACMEGGGDDDKAINEKVWTDPSTGLMWQVTPSGECEWNEAIKYCDDLVLAERAGWRIPTVSELRSLIRNCPYTETGGTCGITDDCLGGKDCYNNSCEGCESSFEQNDSCNWPTQLLGECECYWSSSSEPSEGEFNEYAWTVCFNGGWLGDGAKENGEVVYLRCVR